MRVLALLAGLSTLVLASACEHTPWSSVKAGSSDKALETTADSRPAAPSDQQGGYSKDEIVKISADFFGTTTAATAQVVERVFREQGQPVGYIKGEEASAAVGVGARYGEGVLTLRNGQTRAVYWQGPSIGFDTGANASKVFTLVYALSDPDSIYQRFPGVEGSAYFIGGIGVNYQQSGKVVLAPMRTGVGLRAGVNIGYLNYSRERQVLPL